MTTRTAPTDLSPGLLHKVTAIVRSTVLERAEARLQAIHVPGISVTKVKGDGEYANFYTADGSCEHARIEIYCRHECADEIARAIVDSAHTGLEGDGLVAVLPIESIYRVRTGNVATSDEIGGCKSMCHNDRTRPSTEENHGPIPC